MMWSPPYRIEQMRNQIWREANLFLPKFPNSTNNTKVVLNPRYFDGFNPLILQEQPAEALPWKESPIYQYVHRKTKLKLMNIVSAPRQYFVENGHSGWCVGQKEGENVGGL